MDVDIPLSYLKNQREVLIPLLTPELCCFSLGTMLLLKAGPIPLLKAGAAFHWTDPSCKLWAALTMNSSQAHRAEAGDTDTSWYSVSLGNDSPAIAWETLLWGVPNTTRWVSLCCMGHLETRSCFEVSGDSAFLSWTRGCFLIVSLASHCFPAKAVV